MVMASAGVNMAGHGGEGGGGGNPAASTTSSECRLRRRRRFSPRRHVPEATSAASEEAAEDVVATTGGAEKRARSVQFPPSSSPASASSSSVAASEGSTSDGEEVVAGAQLAAPAPLPEEASTAAEVWPVAFGSVSLAGRLREMEDTVSLRPALCTWADGSPMHFFAVFDGHGGPHVAALCREQMHVVLASELAAEAATALQQQQSAAEEERAWRSALSRSFARVDALAALACACGRAAEPACACPLSGHTAGAIVGTTAVVALLVRDRLVVANCGDSRAVLCRAGAGPDRPDEKARIEAAGGRVVYLNGPRVRGILAMSRALGHKYLKPEVICEPEITITERTADDDCIILASDGMWDVISNETACDVARQCLEDGSPSRGRAAGSSEAAPGSSSSSGRGAPVGQQSEPRCYRAAALLARLALGRESSDNISVIVIDLKGRG